MINSHFSAFDIPNHAKYETGLYGYRGSTGFATRLPGRLRSVVHACRSSLVVSAGGVTSCVIRIGDSRCWAGEDC